MKIRRDISGRGIIKALKVFGYETVRQNGSHNGYFNKEWLTSFGVPNHNPLKVRTLNGIISQVAQHFQLTKEEVLNQLFR